MKNSFFVFFDTLVQMAECEPNMPASLRSHSNKANKALLVHNRRLSFSRFEILFNLLADKYGLCGRVDFQTEIFKLGTHNVSLSLIFKQ